MYYNAFFLEKIWAIGVEIKRKKRLCMHVDAHLGDNVLFSFIALLLIFFHVVKFANKRVKNKIWSTQLPPFSIPWIGSPDD